MHPKDISIFDYTYTLPNERIAANPLPERDDSKLLIYKEGSISEDRYNNITTHLPAGSLLVFNNTRVIQARLLFQKPSGGIIEIFCLEPYGTSHEYTTVMATREKLRWKCLVGGASKWKEGHLQKELTIGNQSLTLTAQLVEKLPDAYVVELAWQPAQLSFAEIIDCMGNTPLPPYIKRKPEEGDKERYQTIYAQHDGSVAAPTAGLHFTTGIFDALADKGIGSAQVTLHVGAGTFKPVKSALMEGHAMHSEWIDVSLATLEILLRHLEKGIIAVGTTSMRTLESLYWMGVKTSMFPEIVLAELAIGQWDVYSPPLDGSSMPATIALAALVDWMQRQELQHLVTHTQLLIAPGYVYRIPKALVTNFHQPQSTLLLLVAAAIGEDWKRVYQYALDNDFRFLSYGDGSLLYLPERNC